jgi:superfamily I DNA/RNA helicase
LLLEGPGTSKSYTILGYIKYLIEDEDPENIYVLTFTRAATNELKQKMKKKIK